MLYTAIDRNSQLKKEDLITLRVDREKSLTKAPGSPIVLPRQENNKSLGQASLATTMLPLPSAENWKLEEIGETDSALQKSLNLLTPKKHCPVTIFALPKPFKGHIGVIQRNAITSWTRLKEKPEIILFGDDEGTAEIAEELGIYHIPEIKRNEYGTPRLDYMFAKTHELAKGNIITYTNSDIIITRDFIPAVLHVASQFKDFLMVGRRWNLDVTELINFEEQNWEDKLRQVVNENGVLYNVDSMDYFTFPKHLYAQIPEFAIGRGYWDTWMIHEAVSKNYPIIDASHVATIVHQNHDYSHMKGGRKEAHEGPEAQRNKYFGGGNITGNTSQAKWILTTQELNQSPLVSVVIYAYNNESLLQSVLESVSSQTDVNTEIIFIDDGSTDSTQKVLQPYYNSLRYVYQEHQGILAARNRGIQIAEGKFIKFINAGDSFLIADKLAEEVACFESQASTDIVCSGWSLVDGEGKMIRNVELWKQIPKLELHTWITNNPIPIDGILFIRDWLKIVGGFNTKLPEKIAGVELLTRLGLRGCNAVWLQEVTYCYRQQEEDAKNISDMFNDFEAMLANIFALPQVPEWMPPLEPLARYRFLLRSAWLAYKSGSYKEMAQFLQKSLSFTPHPPIATIFNWVETFRQLSLWNGENFDSESFSEIPEWKQLLSDLIGYLSSCQPGNSQEAA